MEFTSKLRFHHGGPMHDHRHSEFSESVKTFIDVSQRMPLSQESLIDAGVNVHVAKALLMRDPESQKRKKEHETLIKDTIKLIFG